MKKLKIGVFGGNIRGVDLAKAFMLLDCEIVAVCERREERYDVIHEHLGKDVPIFDKFEDFIEVEMDACILANFFHEHAPFAIECFRRNIHVFSECISNGTMAEGVELVRAFENTKSIYFLAENYPQMIFNREIQRVCASGTLGKIMYAEGEYNHPGDPMDTRFKKDYNYFEGHWRNYLPRTYYVTHSLGPIMRATGATPKIVTAFSIPAPVADNVPSASYSCDRASIMMTQNDDGSVFRFTGCAAFGGHHNAYRVCGTDGSIENVRGLDNKVVLHYNDWTKPEGAEDVNYYSPGWNDPDEKLIIETGHGGADFITARMFVECIRENKQPEHPFNLHSAIAMSSVAILAHRSALEGGKPYEIPDFTKEDERKKYENDRISPFLKEDGTCDIPCCTDPTYKPTETQLKLYRKMVLGIDE